MNDLYRICVKLYAHSQSGLDDARFVPIFHDWIRARRLDAVLIDVADYTHVPDGPGILLVAHEVSFALDRSDGRFGLLVQRRRPADGGVDDAIEHTLRHALHAAERLEREPRLAGALSFDRTQIRVESNDRLLAANDDASFRELSSHVHAVGQRVFENRGIDVKRIENDPRDRLALDVRVA
jgi:hypothetical protein